MKGVRADVSCRVFLGADTMVDFPDPPDTHTFG